MNRTYYPATDSPNPPHPTARNVSPQYLECRQALYNLLAHYSQPDAIAALEKTLQEWRTP